MFNSPSNKAKRACKSRLLNALHYCDKRYFEREGFKGYVYVIRCQNFIKIGVADNPRKRVTELQVGCPYKLDLIQSFASKCPRGDERRLHNLLRKHHQRGEWFKLTDNMIELLKTFGAYL